MLHAAILRLDGDCLMSTSAKAIIAAAVAAMPAALGHDVVVTTTDPTAHLIENRRGGVPGMAAPLRALGLASSTVATEGRPRVIV